MSHRPQVFKPRVNALTAVFLVASVVAIVAISVIAGLLARSGYATGQGQVPEQPVPFSHKHHVGALGIDCGYCHTSVTQSQFAGVPPTHTCMTCHSQLWTHADMLAPVRKSLETDTPIHWKRVHNLADYVYFNHEVHVNNGIGCETCHGRVDQMPLMTQHAPLTMQWCLDCHRDPAPNLRPANQIMTMGFKPGPDTPPGHELMKQYKINPKGLTDCVTCHR